jgi:hypothetical protein
MAMPKSGAGQAGKVFNQTALSKFSYQPGTYYDKGLFDAREIGYIY